MAQFKSLLINAKVETAKKARKCQHNKANHQIVAGEICLAVKDAFGGSRSYCSKCASEMLLLTTVELNALVQALEGNRSHETSKA